MDILKSGVAFSEAATVLTPDFIGYVNQNFPNNVSNQVFANLHSAGVWLGRVESE